MLEKTIIKLFPSLPMSDMKGPCRIPNLVEEINPAPVSFHNHT